MKNVYSNEISQIEPSKKLTDFESFQILVFTVGGFQTHEIHFGFLVHFRLQYLAIDLTLYSKSLSSISCTELNKLETYCHIGLGPQAVWAETISLWWPQSNIAVIAGLSITRQQSNTQPLTQPQNITETTLVMWADA